jgi:hypothetical protein
MEANLTTLLHGDGSAALSLHVDELPEAVGAYLDMAAQMFPHSGLPVPKYWDVHRMDPSTTYVLPDDVPVPLVIDAAWRAFQGAANGRQSVSRHNNETVTFRMSAWRSWTVYDKGAEIARKTPGAVAQTNLIRMEARVRPRKGTGEWKEAQPTLAAMETMISKSGAEAMSMMGSVAQYLGAGTTLAIVRALVRGGASPNTALRLAAAVELSESLGDKALLEVGVDERTARRWKSEVRKYLAAGGGEDGFLEDMPDLLRAVMPVYARDHKLAFDE